MNKPNEMLALADFSGMTESHVKDKIADDFGIDRASIENDQIVVAYMSVGSWGCDSGAFIVFRRNGTLYEVNGSHCSCYGFDERGGDAGTQWQPEAIGDIENVLQRKDYALACGGYDNDQATNAAAIRDALRRATKAGEQA